ncbi:MAG TPA: hypothetical protein DCL21_00850 [Alphaproteobacteria bacterium]|nr:hypothetical protein [Alphaproteobacteria bacterium]
MKKGAMFGLESRVLKKQCHPELDSGSQQKVMNLWQRFQVKPGMTKLGAMFGLDARIALAIFGALSVISGAALYTAIQEARVTALLADLNEVGKSYEQYYLDTGTDVAMSDAYSVISKNLVVNPSVAGWKGPYLNYSISTINTNLLFYPNIKDSLLYMIKLKRADFADNLTHSGACADVKECDLYIAIREPIAGKNIENIVSKLSLKVDGNTNLLTGKIRSIQSASYVYLYFKYMPAQSI